MSIPKELKPTTTTHSSQEESQTLSLFNTQAIPLPPLHLQLFQYPTESLESPILEKSVTQIVPKKIPNYSDLQDEDSHFRDQLILTFQQKVHEICETRFLSDSEVASIPQNLRDDYKRIRQEQRSLFAEDLKHYAFTKYEQSCCIKTLHAKISSIPKFEGHNVVYSINGYLDNNVCNTFDQIDSVEKIYLMLDLTHQLYTTLYTDKNFELSMDSYFTLIQPDKNNPIALPSVFGMALLLAYYEEKYDLSLHIGTIAECQKLIEIQPMNEPFGMIIIPDIIPESFKVLGSQERITPHVTPVIICKTPTQIQICELDSVERYSAIHAMPIENLSIIRPHCSRQADPYSCRNDAINILSNALWDLKQNQSSDLSIYHENPLPAAWCKTFQVSKNLPDTSGLIRTKNEDKCLATFLKIHTDESGKRRYLLNKGYKYAHRLRDLINHRENYSPNIFTRYQSKLESLALQGFHLIPPSCKDLFTPKPQAISMSATLQSTKVPLEPKLEIVQPQITNSPHPITAAKRRRVGTRELVGIGVHPSHLKEDINSNHYHKPITRHAKK